MIFDDLNKQKARQSVTSGDGGQRRRRRRSGAHRGTDHPSGRRRTSSFDTASRLGQPLRGVEARDNTVWLWVLGVLIVAAAGFALYLHNERAMAQPLTGEAPTAALLPYVDPILAPLQTGEAGYSAESLDELAARFRAERGKVALDDAEIYATAASVAEFLQQALADRVRHLQRLEHLDSGNAATPAESGAVRPVMSRNERQHLELAVDVSWQRNSTAHRNSIERLWARLERLEQGRFRPDPAPQSKTGQP